MTARLVAVLVLSLGIAGCGGTIEGGGDSGPGGGDGGGSGGDGGAGSGDGGGGSDGGGGGGDDGGGSDGGGSDGGGSDGGGGQDGGLATGLAWAGVRSSGYGIAQAGFSSFPSPAEWTTAMTTMAGYFPGATPSATIWLVGEVDYDQDGMLLEFPKPDDGKTYGPLYQFSSTDKHEPYFSYFDTHGVQVYPELEPGDADIPTLIDLVLSRYHTHSSIIGLAIDAEWINKTSDSDTETPVSDAQAEAWEARVKSYSASYRLLLKHFDEGNLPPNYRGDIVFGNDDELNGSYSTFKAELETFADFFYPSDVVFQFGYPSDRTWWKNLQSPIPQTIGEDLKAQTRQRFGVLWVDFTINDPLIELIP